MKKIFACYAAALALLFASCAKSEVEMPAGGSSETGSLSLRILTETRAAEGAYDPMDYCTIRIYSGQGLIRRYTSLAEMPEELQLLAGAYTIDVEAGDKSAASFTNKSYHGRQEFSVTAGQQTAVEVVCPTLNAAVAVDYDASVAESLQAGFSTSVRMGGDVLKYTSSATGYFLPAADDTELSWSFAGVHPEKGDVVKEGTLRVKAGYKYNLKFAYSADAAGLLSFTVTVVEPSPENGGDIIIFSPEPTFKGDGFDMATAQKFYNTTKSILVTSPNALSGLTLALEGTVYDLVGAAAPGVTLTKTDETNWVVTLTDDLFSALTGGDHEVHLSATDVEGGTGKASAVFTTQGIVPATAADYDLWTNTGDIRVKVYDPSVNSVQVKLRRSGGEWAAFEAVRQDAETFAAHVEPAWTEATSLGGDPVYLPDNRKGIFANATYEAKAVIGGEEKEAVATFSTTVDQPIPYCGMEDASLSCFTTSNTSAAFWGSGNNTISPSNNTDKLCAQSTYAGMGGSHCACLSSTNAIIALAAGNLFSGDFSLNSTRGTVYFGKDYDWKARPTGLKMKIHAKVGAVDKEANTGDSRNPLRKGDPDKARIFFAIVDWTAQHQVTSGVGAPTGVWDPEKEKTTDEGKVIGYGSCYLMDGDECTRGDAMVDLEIPISYYDKTAKPSNAYKIVISCASNAYGDFMTGCTTNKIYVDDFEWVY